MSDSAVSVLTPGAGGRVLDFRRRGTPPRRKRRSLVWTLGKPLVIALILVGVPAALVAWVLTAPRFGLSEIEVIPALELAGTTRRVPDETVRRALAPLKGENLVRLSLSDAARLVERNPWIGSVEIAKELPARLRVRIAERQPVALLVGPDGGLVYADRDGRTIAPVRTPAELQEAPNRKLLVVSFSQRPHGEGIAAALGVAAELGRAQPTWAGQLARIEVLGEEDFRLHTDALPFPLLVRSGQVKPKVERLVELLPELSRRYAKIEAVDLRFSRRIVVQPVPSTPPSGGTGSLKIQT